MAFQKVQKESPYSVQMRENTDQKNSEYGHFSRSVNTLDHTDYFFCFEKLEIITIKNLNPAMKISGNPQVVHYYKFSITLHYYKSLYNKYIFYINVFVSKETYGLQSGLLRNKK